MRVVNIWQKKEILIYRSYVAVYGKKG